MTKVRWIVALVIAALLIAAYVLDVGQYLSLEFFQDRQARIEDIVSENFLTTAFVFAAIYIVVAVLNLPAAGILTVIAGAAFGLLNGTIIVSFASSIGATLSLLLARFLLRDWVEGRFSGWVQRINAGVEKDGAWFLFSLRLIPVIPFFAINMAMGLTRLRALTFYWVSQLGMLPVTAIYVNAGTQISQIETVDDILSPGLIGSLILIAAFPLVAKYVMVAVNRRRRLQDFRRPASFDTNLVVIGAGSAGLVTAYVAAAAKAKVTLIEAEKMGGDCLNTGCVPSKALIRSARVAATIRDSERFGLRSKDPDVDFPAIMQRVQRIISAIEPHDSIERYQALGVDCVTGRATIKSPWEVDVDGQPITTRAIVVATGGRPAVPPIPGLAETGFRTSETIWHVETLPRRLLVLGGGPIGCELAQAFARLGSAVTLVEMAPRLLGQEDEEVGEQVAGGLRADGVEIMTGWKAGSFSRTGRPRVAHCESEHGRRDIEFDEVLVAVGRRPNTENLGLEKIGVRLREDKTVAVNDYLQTDCPTVFACGDVTGPYQLTHAAGHQGWYCAMNALFGRIKKFRVDYSALPWAVFTDPEVAHVGLNEQAAREQRIDVEITRYGIDDLDRAIADSAANGFVKILTVPGKDRILGVTIVGPHAGELIIEFVTAMRHGMGLRKILGTIHIYPTLAEANKYAAGEWQKTHLPDAALKLAALFHAWRR